MPVPRNVCATMSCAGWRALRPAFFPDKPEDEQTGNLSVEFTTGCKLAEHVANEVLTVCEREKP